MSDIKNIIGKICPEAQFTDGDILEVTVPDIVWHPLAEALRNTKGLEFDLLSAVVGMDW